MAPSGPAQADFFLSYTQADRPWAEWIAWELEAAGFATTIQAWDFRPGSNFVVEMQRASAGAERTVPVLSPDYLQSGFAMAEWAAAFAQDPTGEKGKVLPVRVRRTELDGLLSSIVYIDLVDLAEAAARERLLAGLARGRAKPAAKPLFPGGLPGGPPPRFPGEPIAPPDPAKAAARLAELPLDDVPDPAPLPPGSRMPLSANPLFVGRQDDLRALARSLKVGETAAIGQIAAATGLGGIGKTQLACEFVHRYGCFFEGGVFWMSFADEAAVPAEVAACGRSLGLHPGYDGLPLDQQVRLVEEAWQSPLPRLLVFDNCEDPRLLDQRRPRSGGARVLVTSRRSRWDPAFGVKALPLDTLDRPVSVELLRRFRPDVPAEDAALGGIAEALGDLPLALHLAGSFLARYKEASFGQPAAYLDQLGRGDLLTHPSLQGKGSEISPTGHEAHVARTFALGYERLDPADPTDAVARKLLARAAHFASGEPIPRPLLLATLHLAGEEADALLTAEDALDRLIGLGLLESGEGGRLVLHRLVAAFARRRDEEDEAREAVEEALFAEAYRLNQAGYPAPLLAWQAHLRAATESAWEQESTRTAKLCDELGYHLWMISDLVGARPYWDRALAIYETVFGPEHPDTARSLNNLGVLLDSQSALGARPCHERALAIREKVLGPDHPDTALSLSNLGVLLFEAQGDLAGARPYFERALAIREKVLGPEHPDTAHSLGNLGSLFQSQGYLSGARPYYERALAIREKALGSEHPDTARSLNSLGELLQSQGHLSGARPYYERALVILEKVFGPEHPDTAHSLNNLGFLLQSQGDFAGAQPHYERALAIREKVFGPEHPGTAHSLNNLGALLQAQGDFAGAHPYYERALAIREKVFGPEHPDTALSLNNLGALLQSRGDLAEARPYYERALAIREKVFGPEHPDTAFSLNNLGALLQAQGDFAGALPYCERALAIREKIFGLEHPDTAQSLNRLGLLLQDQGDFAEAHLYYERALAIWEKVLGPEHPDTAVSLNNLGCLLQARGDLVGARPYYERALEIWEKVLGPEHPDTAQSLNNLGALLQAQGDFAGVRPYYERALAIREKILGPEHPDTAQSLNRLGLLLQAQGDLAKARPYYERAQAIWEKVLGPEHPDTAVSLNNLGFLLQSQGDLVGARPYYERALTIWEKNLGPEHPDTAQSLNNLGLLLQAQGDLVGARPYSERALAIREKMLGPGHPDTAQSLNNLGFLLQAHGDPVGARPYYERALAIWEKSLGPDHPNTKIARGNLERLPAPD